MLGKGSRGEWASTHMLTRTGTYSPVDKNIHKLKWHVPSLCSLSFCFIPLQL